MQTARDFAVKMTVFDLCNTARVVSRVRLCLALYRDDVKHTWCLALCLIDATHTRCLAPIMLIRNIPGFGTASC